MARLPTDAGKLARTRGVAGFEAAAGLVVVRPRADADLHAGVSEPCGPHLSRGELDRGVREIEQDEATPG